MPDCPPILEYATAAHQGRRACQEDFSVVMHPTVGGRPDGSILVVLADGMGGHASGEFASRIACDAYVSSFAGSEPGDIGPRMAVALDYSNAEIGAAVRGNPQLAGMGCTLIAGLFDHEGLRWVSVGDSTLLHFRDGTLRRLNADHSHGAVLDKQAAAGIISKEEAMADARRHALHSALTGERIPLRNLELQALPLAEGDYVIAASDGLLTLSGDEIAEILHGVSEASIEHVGEALLTAVLTKDDPRQDNTTLVVVRVGAAQSDDLLPKETIEPQAVVAAKGKTGGWFSRFRR